MLILVIIALILFVGIGIGVGYWFADLTKISNLRCQNAQLKAKVDKLQTLVDYYEGKPTL